jgi:hypothetical protein
MALGSAAQGDQRTPEARGKSAKASVRIISGR